MKMELQHHATVVLHQFHIRVPDLLIFSAADGQHLPTGQRDFIVSDAPDEAVIEQVSLVNPQKALGRQFFFQFLHAFMQLHGRVLAQDMGHLCFTAALDIL